MKVYVMRGLPGSGKTTWIKNNHPNALVVSADHYHIGRDGLYHFDPTKAPAAHNCCLTEFLNYLLDHEPYSPGDGKGVLVVDNTNTEVWQFAAYYRLAEAFGCEVEIVYLPCDPITAFRRNVHSVPAGTILKMHRALMTERLPTHWKETLAEA